MDTSQPGQIGMAPRRLVSAPSDTSLSAPKQGGVLKLVSGMEIKQYVWVSQSSTRFDAILECFSSCATAHQTSSSPKCDILLYK